MRDIRLFRADRLYQKHLQRIVDALLANGIECHIQVPALMVKNSKFTDYGLSFSRDLLNLMPRACSRGVRITREFNSRSKASYRVNSFDFVLSCLRKK